MKLLLGALALLSLAASVHAATINVGVVGTAAETNNWPAAENPSAAIDGAGQKYLNFGEFNTGVIVFAAASTAVSMTLTTANDSEPRDPASYVLMGTNNAIGAGPFDTADFSLIASGGLALPASRNAGGLAALDPANQQTVNFANAISYSTYLIYFPTVKDSDSANSMQIGEIQLNDPTGSQIFAPTFPIVGVQVVPEPSAGMLALLALAGFGLRRRR